MKITYKEYVLFNMTLIEQTFWINSFFIVLVDTKNKKGKSQIAREYIKITL